MTKSKEERESVVESKSIKKTFKGVTVSLFKIKNKSYLVGDLFETKSEFNYKTLINSKKIIKNG